MFISKILATISLYAGILILAIGIILQLLGTTDEGLAFTKTGGTGIGSINGPGTISLGVITLLFSLLWFLQHKKQVRERQNMLEKENAKLTKRKSKATHK